MGKKELKLSEMRWLGLPFSFWAPTEISITDSRDIVLPKKRRAMMLAPALKCGAKRILPIAIRI